MKDTKQLCFCRIKSVKVGSIQVKRCRVNLTCVMTAVVTVVR